MTSVTHFRYLSEVGTWLQHLKAYPDFWFKGQFEPQ